MGQWMDKPKVSGWYWWFEMNSEPKIYYFESRKPVLIVGSPGGSHEPPVNRPVWPDELEFFKDGKWYGPIAPPKRG